MVFWVQSLTIGLDPTWKLVLRSFTQGVFLIISYLFQYYFWPNLIIWICMQALHLTISFCSFCGFYLDQGVCGSVVCRAQLLTIGLDPTWKLVLRSFTQVPVTGKFLLLAKVFSFPLFFFLQYFSIISHHFSPYCWYNFSTTIHTCLSWTSITILGSNTTFPTFATTTLSRLMMMLFNFSIFKPIFWL